MAKKKDSVIFLTGSYSLLAFLSIDKKSYLLSTFDFLFKKWKLFLKNSASGNGGSGLY